MAVPRSSKSSASSAPVHIVLGVIARAGRVLVAWRDERRHQGGRLEFPGGKVERGESPEQALRRELNEEIGVAAEVGARLIRFVHDYGDRQLLLDVREAHIKDNSVIASDERRIEWRLPETLSAEEFPPANHAILTALKLPHTYAITPPARSGDDVSHVQINRALESHIRDYVEQLLSSGERLILFRVKGADAAAYRRLAEDLVVRVRAAGARLMLHDCPDEVAALGAAGVHLSQAAFRSTYIGDEPAKKRCPSDALLSVSCHDADEVRRAEAAGADFCVLGPVRKTPGHGAPIGFDVFEAIVADARIPVYALGGMRLEDLVEARARGAQGIAGIRPFDQHTARRAGRRVGRRGDL